MGISMLVKFGKRGTRFSWRCDSHAPISHVTLWIIDEALQHPSVIPQELTSCPAGEQSPSIAGARLGMCIVVRWFMASEPIQNKPKKNALLFFFFTVHLIKIKKKASLLTSDHANSSQMAENCCGRKESWFTFVVDVKKSLNWKCFFDHLCLS